MGEVLISIFITPTRTPFCLKNLKGNPFFFHGEDFLGFSPKPFLRIIIIAALTIATLATAIAIIITAIITTIAINGTLIRIKIFPSGEAF